MGKRERCCPRPHPSEQGCKQAHYETGESYTMKSDIKPLPVRSTCKALADHIQQIKKLHLRDVFAQDAKRGDRFAAEACGLFLDYSKNRITGDTVDMLVQLAD